MNKKLTITIPDGTDAIGIANAILEAVGNPGRVKPEEERFFWEANELQDRVTGDLHITIYETYPFDLDALKQCIFDQVRGQEVIEVRYKLVVEIVKTPGGERKGRITEQSHRGTEFCLTGYEFTASNGFRLKSWRFPESNCWGLYCRGNMRDRDDYPFRIPTGKWLARLRVAVKEYNAQKPAPRQPKPEPEPAPMEVLEVIE